MSDPPRRVSSFLVPGRALLLAPLALCAGSAFGQSLVADFVFDGAVLAPPATLVTLNDLGDNLFTTETIDGFDLDVLHFPEGSGLSLSPVTAVLPQGAYSVAILFRFEDVSGFRKILDFKSGTSDLGLYVYYGDLVFFNLANGSGAPVSPNQWVQVVLTRDALGNSAGYVDGAPQIQFPDTEGDALAGEEDEFRLFQDDVETSGSEASAGSVARIRVFDFPLSPAQVPLLDRVPCSFIPDAAASDLAVTKIRVKPRVKLSQA
ncbi:MAG: LamG-like jellyroll fold domain-containing protein, partial [Planctomycetota bacterium]